MIVNVHNITLENRWDGVGRCETRGTRRSGGCEVVLAGKDGAADAVRENGSIPGWWEKAYILPCQKNILFYRWDILYPTSAVIPPKRGLEKNSSGFR